MKRRRFISAVNVELDSALLKYHTVSEKLIQTFIPVVLKFKISIKSETLSTSIDWISLLTFCRIQRTFHRDVSW